MRNRTKLAASAGAALAVAGAGGAIAATKLSPGQESKAVVEDAAKQLGVDPAKLSDALKQALENRVDQAVEDGALTKEQGEAMKQRLEADDFPLFGGPLLGHPHRGGFGFRALRDLDVAATYLGLSEAELRDALREGKTLADVAEDERKDVDGLVDAIVAATTKRLDEAVADGRMTKAQRDEIAQGLKERTEDIVNGRLPALGDRQGFRFRGPGLGPGFGHHERETPPPAA